MRWAPVICPFKRSFFDFRLQTFIRFDRIGVSQHCGIRPGLVHCFDAEPNAGPERSHKIFKYLSLAHGATGMILEKVYKGQPWLSARLRVKRIY